LNADLLIIGAGPAGIAAASEAARSGASFNLIDETGRAGGAIGLAYETRGIPFVADRGLPQPTRSAWCTRAAEHGNCRAPGAKRPRLVEGHVGASNDRDLQRDRILDVRRAAGPRGLQERRESRNGWNHGSGAGGDHDGPRAQLLPALGAGDHAPGLFG